jgi:hypothetical protein
VRQSIALAEGDQEHDSTQHLPPKQTFRDTPPDNPKTASGHSTTALAPGNIQIKAGRVPESSAWEAAAKPEVRRECIF